MNTKHLLIASIAFAIAGCAAFTPHSVPRTGGGYGVTRCTAGTCTVEVQVTTNGRSCDITSPRKRDGILVRDGVFDVSWEITTPGYEFDDQPPAARAIHFPSLQAGNPIFTNPGLGPTKKTYKYTDNNNAPDHKGVFPYHIFVKSTDGSIKCRLDPYVVNDESGHP